MLLDSEDEFGGLYGSTGRPNFSVARVLGIVWLQEMQGLSDQAALDSYSFDARWQHAMDVTDENGYFSRRSLVEFRRRLVEQDEEMLLIRRVFDKSTSKALCRFQTSAAEQRLDSTHVVSNIRIAGVLDLFDSTVRHFIKSLGQADYLHASSKIRSWYEQDNNGYFGLVNAERRVKAQQVAQFAVALLDGFESREEVVASEPYKLMQRLVDDYCTVTARTIPSSKKRKKGRKKRNAPRIEKTVVIDTRKKTKVGKLQSVHDPGATHGHKGVGYSAQITETCNNKEKPELITDYEVTGANRADVGKAKDVVDRLEARELQPEVLFADAGYPTPQQLVELRENGTELFAPVHRGPMKDKMGRDRFEFDEAQLVLLCPAGHAPTDHKVRNPNGEGAPVHAYFDGDTCRDCPMLETCPVRAPNHRKKGTPRKESRGDFRLTITAALIARDKRFAEQKTDAWRERYAIRAGIEATNSELKRAHAFGRLRVRKRPRVLFAIASKLSACNVKRWLRGLAEAALAPPNAALLLLCACLTAVLRTIYLPQPRILTLARGRSTA